MQFFIAASVLAVLSTAVLLYQFWSEALTGTAELTGPDEAPVELEPASELRAA